MIALGSSPRDTLSRRLARTAVRAAVAIAAVAAVAAILAILGYSPPAAAAPRKILVLPVDGTADAATRAKLTGQISRLAKALDGQVATADATFEDTALAVGCDPKAAGCRDQVMATLGVDELIWATAVKDADHTRLVVRRAAKGGAERELPATLAASDSPDQLNAALAPLFTPPGSAPGAPGPADPPPLGAPPAPSNAPGADARPAAMPDVDEPRRDHTVGVAFGVGGGVALALGLTLWVSYVGLQDSIDHHSTATRSDFDDLTALEDRASTYAIAGDVLVVAGLAAGGVAAYYLYRDHQRHTVSITPAPIAHGAALTLTILGDL